ncbi:MAG: hypothetical protein FWC20_04435 [Oscillospiraceae bacterium]|nr:hypothetical protein [Oscillospiraceae bacterium]MCL2278640.1 hypothetical protein [Oscillospiraceae bacterium]
MAKLDRNKVINELSAKIDTLDQKISVMQSKKKSLEKSIEKHRIELFKDDLPKYERLMKAAEDAGLDYDGVLQLFLNTTNVSPHSEDSLESVVPKLSNNNQLANKVSS